MTDAERLRFESKFVTTPTGCHLWQPSLDRDGYGIFFLRGAGRKAHRVAWFDAFGEIPKGYVINHVCRKRNCVNPQHLQILTPYENTHRDSNSLPYINSQKTVCPEGHPYDATESAGGGRTIRICSSCRRKKQAAARKRRHARARAELSV